MSAGSSAQRQPPTSPPAASFRGASSEGPTRPTLPPHVLLAAAVVCGRSDKRHLVTNSAHQGSESFGRNSFPARAPPGGATCPPPAGPAGPRGLSRPLSQDWPASIGKTVRESDLLVFAVNEQNPLPRGTHNTHLHVERSPWKRCLEVLGKLRSNTGFPEVPGIQKQS